MLRHRPARPPLATVRLTGDRAEALADRLLAGRSDRLDLVWDELLARGDRAAQPPGALGA